MLIQAPLKSLSLQNTDILLKKGSTAKSKVRALQMLLYGLGYGEQLKWSVYRADGDYGGGTTKALSAFKKRNDLGDDGTEVDTKTMDLLLARYALLPLMRNIHNATEEAQIQSLFTGASGTGKTIKLAQAAKLQFAASSPSFKEAKTALDTLKSKYGKDFLTSLYEGETGVKPKTTSESKRYVVVDDWSRVKLTKHKKGVWTMGGDTPKGFISNNESLLLDSGLSPSDVRIITPVSSNEGNLNAINTWDNCFMTFGMFQWTLGQGKAKGELPAMLKRLREKEPDAFEQYFGRHGIDLANTDKTLGYLVLSDAKINSVTAKEKFRKGPDWAFRFWKAGLDSRVKRVQVGHALDRINSFLFNDNYKPLNKFHIGDLITSEYGLCLLLDHHVNRPGHLMSYRIGKKDILGQALKKAHLQDSKPSEWGTDEEQKLINAYLPLRYASSMTHSKKRAAKIKTYLDKGLLSKERFSYEAAPKVAASRGLDTPDSYNTIGDSYSVIDFKEYEEREIME